MRRDGPLRGSIYAVPEAEDYSVDVSNLSDLDMVDDVSYDEVHQQELMRLGEVLGRQTLPGVFFLWENSD